MGCSGGHLRRALQDVTGRGVEASNCAHVDGRASHIADKRQSRYDSSQAGEGKGEHFAVGRGAGIATGRVPFPFMPFALCSWKGTR